MLGKKSSRFLQEPGEEEHFNYMIGILNYGLGNVSAFQNIYKRLGVNCTTVSNEYELLNVNKIIIPGVGSFDWALTRLKESKMGDVLKERVISEHVPVLGVCVGMQMMAESSEEGELPGLGWFEGRVENLDKNSSSSFPLPHMGWNDVKSVGNDPLFDGLEDSRFYFLHSYCFSQSVSADFVACATYGRKFAAAISRSNIYGVQFHPEKSHHWGMRLLGNFARL